MGLSDASHAFPSPLRLLETYERRSATNYIDATKQVLWGNICALSLHTRIVGNRSHFEHNAQPYRSLLQLLQQIRAILSVLRPKTAQLKKVAAKTMRLFRKKKKETPRKSKPASIYYAPAAEEAIVPRTPQERALADFAAQTPPTLRTPVQIPSSRNGDLDGADLRDTLARADIDPEAKRRLEALLDRLEKAELAATDLKTPRRQVSWDPATVERPPIVKDESWRSLQRAPSTPTTPSKHLLLAFGLDDAANSPTAKRRRRGYLFAAGALAVACVFAGAAPALSRESRRRAALRKPPEPVAPLAKDTVAVIRAACLTKEQPLAKIGCAARLTVARLRKHIVKLAVLVVMGCVEINQCVGCTRQFFTKSFLGNDAAVLAPSSGEEPTSPRHRAGGASMARRATRRFRSNAP